MRELRERNCSSCEVNCMLSPFFNETDQANFNSKREINFKKGETIFKQGSFLSKIIILQEGLVKLFIEGSDGKDMIIRFCGPNEYLGLTQVFGKNESRFTAEVLKKTRICMIEINHFKKLLSKHPELKDEMFGHFCEEHDFLYKRLGTIGARNLHGRLAEAIMYLWDKHLAGFDIYEHITRKDLAELSAMSVESMIRILNEFRDDRLIDIDGKHIRINNIETMRTLGSIG